MADKLANLLREGKIDELSYRAYITFRGNDVASLFLRQMLESIVMEEPIKPTKQLFAWHDGRRSVWRDIKRMIDNIEKKLEKVK